MHAPPTPAIYTLSSTTLFRSDEANECHRQPPATDPPASRHHRPLLPSPHPVRRRPPPVCAPNHRTRSVEHTSELQSPVHLVCRLLLEKTEDVQLNHRRAARDR